MSSIVYCGACGEIYRRIHWNNRGCKSIVWRCVSRLEEKGTDCTSSTVNEEILQKTVVKAINNTICQKNTYLLTLQDNITAVIKEGNDPAEIDRKMAELQKELLRLANTNADYSKVVDEIYHLRELKQDTLARSAEQQGTRQRIEEMANFLAGQADKLLEYDDRLVRKIKVLTFHLHLTKAKRIDTKVG